MRRWRNLVVIGLIGLAGVAHGRTWRVEQDGSGDFQVIQNAVDFAGSGDEILIGPGRFTDVTSHFGLDVCVFLDGTKSLTFIGAGPDQTIIGPEVFQLPYNDYGFYCYFGDVTIRLENLCIQNQSSRGLGAMNSAIHLENCVIDRCLMGVQVDHNVTHLTVLDCQFINGPELGASTALSCGQAHAEIRNVLFDHWFVGLSQDLAGSTDFLVADCTFLGRDYGRSGVYFADGAGGTVERCTFSGWVNYGITLSNAGTVVFRDNVVEDCPGAGVGFNFCQNLTMYGNIIENCHPCLWFGFPFVVHDVRDNHFLRDEEGGGYFVEMPNPYPYGPYYLDLTQNYWGTTDPQEISTWIFDGYDDPDVWMYVDFEPMADGPVRTEGATWGEVKSLFR